MKVLIPLFSFVSLFAQIRFIDHVTPTTQPFETYLFVTNFRDIPCDIQFLPYDIEGNRLPDVSFSLQGHQSIKYKSDDVFGTNPVSHFQILGDTHCGVTIGYQLYDGQGATAHLIESPQRYTDFLIYPGEPEYIFDGMAAVNFGVDPAIITAYVRASDGSDINVVELTDGLPRLHKGLWLLDELVTPDTATIVIHSTEPLDVTLLRGTRPHVVPGYLFEVVPISEPSEDFKAP
ncbi:MAG: hypothetical protein KDC35_11045 [Acidobacteria bacterium]|nr:hypothetical protein [Acidobacteriota bacterium]